MRAYTEFGTLIFNWRLRKSRTAMKQADDIKVTICITPRERFSSAQHPKEATA